MSASLVNITATITTTVLILLEVLSVYVIMATKEMESIAVRSIT